MATVSSITIIPSGSISQRLDDYTSLDSVRSNSTFASVTVGDTWKQCEKWYEAMPGAFFQLANIILCLTFMASGKTEIAAMYTHVMSMISFAVFALWGFLSACALDVIVWGLLIAIINLFQIIITCRRSKKIQLIMRKDGMGHLHATRFKPFNISPQLFVELVTCKVTVTADSKCTFISWKRKGLQALLSKRKRLANILRVMIGKDVASKLYQLNDRSINEKGFRYDIRLPCIMSLPEDMEKRRKAIVTTSQAPGTPGMDDARKYRQKKLGKTAQAKYANMFASKLRARMSMRRSLKGSRKEEH